MWPLPEGNSAGAWASRMAPRKTTTLVAGLRMTGMVAPTVLDGPDQRRLF